MIEAFTIYKNWNVYKRVYHYYYFLIIENEKKILFKFILFFINHYTN